MCHTGDTPCLALLSFLPLNIDLARSTSGAGYPKASKLSTHPTAVDELFPSSQHQPDQTNPGSTKTGQIPEGGEKSKR
jgi:hypothetical protein